jgi:hypothetical protein
MEAKKIEESRKLGKKIANTRHALSLQGIREYPHLRLIGEKLDVKRAYREEKAADKGITAFEDYVNKHMVLPAEKKQGEIVIKILKGIDHMHKAGFDTEMFLKMGVDDQIKFIDKVLKSKKITPELKQMLAKKMKRPLKKWHEVLRTVHNSANALYAAAKERTTTALALTKAFQKDGANYFRMRKQYRLVRKAYKKLKESRKIQKHLLKMDIKSKEQAEKELEMLSQMLAQAEEQYERAEKLLFIEWQEIDQYLLNLDKEITLAVRNKEIPPNSEKQIHELVGFVIEQILKPFVVEINTGVNQLDAKVNELEGKVEKVAKAA